MGSIVQVLSYWLIFAVLNTTESISNTLQTLIPCYHGVRAIFLVWCYNPHPDYGMGATFIHDFVLRPLLQNFDHSDAHSTPGLHDAVEPTPTAGDRTEPRAGSIGGISDLTDAIERSRAAAAAGKEKI